MFNILAELGEAVGCSINAIVIKSVTKYYYILKVLPGENIFRNAIILKQF